MGFNGIKMLDTQLNNSFVNLLFSFSSFGLVMCLYVWFFSLFMLKSAVSGLVLISTQPSSFSIALCLCIS